MAGSGSANTQPIRKAKFWEQSIPGRERRILTPSPTTMEPLAVLSTSALASLGFHVNSGRIALHLAMHRAIRVQSRPWWLT